MKKAPFSDENDSIVHDAVITQEEESDSAASANHVRNNRLHNLVSLVILLGGLFVGSLFVDVAQLADGSGFSARVLKDTKILERDNQTWVAFTEPRIPLTVLTKSDCATCDTDAILLSLRQVMPTLDPKVVDAATDEGKAVAKMYDLVSVPAFIFGEAVSKTEFYLNASDFLVKNGESYTLDTAAVRIPVGAYIETPSIENAAIVTGDPAAPVRIVEFTDFQCPFCKQSHSAIVAVAKKYADRAVLVYRNYPLPSHKNATPAAHAAMCAHAQEKLDAYATLLFDRQEAWGKLADPKETLIGYARELKLNGDDFTTCVNNSTYQDRITADLADGQRFGVSGTPTIFVNDTAHVGLVTEEQLTKLVEAALGNAPTQDADNAAQ